MSRPAPSGRARVSARALADIIRPAVVGSYGVTGLSARSRAERLLGWLRLREPGIRTVVDDGFRVDLYLVVAFGLPVAEVARQAESAVRYALRSAVGREPDLVTIHVGGMRYGSAERAAAQHPASSNGTATLAALETVAVGSAAPATKGRRKAKRSGERQ